MSSGNSSSRGRSEPPCSQSRSRSPRSSSQSRGRSPPSSSHSRGRSTPSGSQTQSRSRPSGSQSQSRSTPSGSQSQSRSTPSGSQSRSRSTSSGSQSRAQSEPPVSQSQVRMPKGFYFRATYTGSSSTQRLPTRTSQPQVSSSGPLSVQGLPTGTSPPRASSSGPLSVQGLPTGTSPPRASSSGTLWSQVLPNWALPSRPRSPKVLHSSIKLRLLPIDNLVMVFSIFVPGDRGPLKFEEPDQTPDRWRNPIAELTKNGKQQAYELGLYYRRTYGNFLPREYQREDVYVYSTDTDRTLMSAQCVLAGLYPPGPDDSWSDQFKNWQPIPIHSRKPDKLYPCLKPLDIGALTEKSDVKMYKAFSRNKPVLEQWHSLYYNTPFCLLDVMLLLDNMQIEARNPDFSVNVPAGTDYSTVAQQAEETILLTFETFTDYIEIGNELLRVVEKAASDHIGEDRNPTRMYLYSLHSLNIATLMGRLQLQLQPQTTDCGFLTFELHKTPTGDYAIKIRQKLKHDAEVTTLNLTGGEEDYIMFEEFRSKLAASGIQHY